jgi:hypothetical protein
MSLADEWHDPSGPIREVPKSPTAQDGLDFIHRGYLAALNARFEQDARAAGMSEDLIQLVVHASQG